MDNYVIQICSVMQIGNRFCDFQKIRVADTMLFIFKSDLNVKETGNKTGNVSEIHALSRPHLEDKVLILKIDIFLKTRDRQELQIPTYNNLCSMSIILRKRGWAQLMDQ